MKGISSIFLVHSGKAFEVPTLSQKPRKDGAPPVILCRKGWATRPLRRYWMIEKTRSRVLLLVLFILIVTSVSAILLAWKFWRDKNRWTRVSVAQVEFEVSRDIPVGTARAQVDSYLDKKKISHSYYGDKPYKDTAYYNSEIALIPRTASSGLVTTHIQIIFKFDPSMKLASHEVHEVYKGP